MADKAGRKEEEFIGRILKLCKSVAGKLAKLYPSSTRLIKTESLRIMDPARQKMKAE